MRHKRVAAGMLICGVVFLGGLVAWRMCKGEGALPLPHPESYREIPGVTPEEIAAIEALKKTYDHFTLAMALSTECFPSEDGEFGGFSRQFRTWLSNLFGIPFRSVVVQWEDLQKGLVDKSLHFTGDLTKTPERARQFHMTDAIAERPIQYYLLSDTETLREIARERPLRYCFLSGSNTYDLVRQHALQDFESVFADSYDEVHALLETGEVDAYLDEAPAQAFFARHPQVRVSDFYPLLFAPVSFSTANPEFRPVIDVVQKALDQGAMRHLNELYTRGHQEYVRHKFLLRLSPVETAYLSEQITRGPVPFAAEIGNYPASFYSAEEQEWQGISIDVLREIEAISGLTFRIANKPTDEFGTLYRMLLDGRVAMISELLPSPEREGLFLWAEPYARDYYALISRTEIPDIRISDIERYRIAIPVDTAVESLFTSWFPHHPHAVKLQSPDECLEALKNNQADLAMSSRNMGLRMTHYYGQPGYKMNLVFDHSYDSIFGFNRDETVLHSIVTKAQRLVNVEMISERWYRKVYDYRGKLAEQRIPYLIGLAVLLALVLFLVSLLLFRKHASSAQLEAMVRSRTRELEIQTRAATVASQAKSEFLSRMSHEIRTPLNAVIGMSQAAKMDTSDPEKMNEALGHILVASGHLLGILNNILDMAKIETGKFTLYHESFLLGRAMDEVCTIFRERCGEKNIVFFEDFSSVSNLRVTGDKLRLNQILINLLGNAVKFTPDGGRIDFQVTLEAERARHYLVRFVVRDSGIGMDMDEVAHLFEAFTQADSSVASKYGGTGLGLSISQNLVRLMDGEIQVASEEGKGATFTFTIPLSRSSRSSPSTKVMNPQPPKLAGKRLLLVDDMEINRMVVRRLLAKTGVEMDVAHDGKEGLDRFTAAPGGYYHLVFMDIQMPVLDGYAATAAIRRSGHPDATSIPIIAMTANAYQSDRDAALAAGMNGHLSKPINIALLYETLRQYLEIYEDS